MWGSRWVWLAAWACVVAVAGGCDRQSSYGKGARAAFAARPQVLEFGPAAVGSTKTVKLRLANEGRASMRIEGAISHVPNVEVPPFEPFSLGAGAEYEVEVRFSPQVEGSVEGVVRILTDADDQGDSGSQVSVLGMGVKAWVEVKSLALDFGNVPLDTVEVRELLVRNPTSVDSPLRLEVVGTDADQFSSSSAAQPQLVLKAGEERRLSVAFKPARLGAATAAVRVSVCEGCEPAVVSLAGTGIASQLEISPLRLDFGRVAVGATSEQAVMVRNQGSEPMRYTGARIVADQASVFRVVSAVAPAGNVLKPGESAEIRVAFTPTALGAVPEGRLEVLVQAVGSTAPGPKVAMVGEGGSSCVSVQPRTIDFGEVAEGMSATRKAEVINRCREQVMLSELQLSTQKGGFFSLAQAPASLPIAAGKSAFVGVTFTPRTGAGAGAARLAVTVRTGGTTATEAVQLVGVGRGFPPCQYTLTPAALDFGSVPVGAPVSLAVALRNTGSTACYLAGMRLVEDSDAAFTATPVENTVLAPGQRTTLLVQFKPEEEATYAGLAEAWVNHPSAGHPTVSVQGTGVRGCFYLQPTHLEFGLTKLSCNPRTRELIAYNKCAAPLTVQGLTVEQQTQEFVVSGASFPKTLQAGEQFKLSATYVPTDDGDDAGALRFALDTGAVFTASMVGRGATQAEQIDDFVQEPESKVDVLFVVDNSGSMMEEQQSLGANFAAFLSAATTAGVDYRIGVTTTGLDTSPGGWSVCPGGADGGENGRLFPVTGNTPRVITRSTPNAASVFATNTQVGVCHWNEQGLEGAYRALSSPLLHAVDDPRTPQPNDGNGEFLRPEARLAIIFVTDEDDFSNQQVSFYETYFRALKDNEPSKLSISAIAGPQDLSTCSTASSSGTRYIQLARATGGVVESICTPNWAESLKKLSSTTFGPKRIFPLTHLPADPSQIAVKVDGQPVTAGWTYDAATNSIVFEEGKAPPPGAYIEVTYPLGC
jgi:hypothetical protein